jgi:hypothetical protein
MALRHLMADGVTLVSQRVRQRRIRPFRVDERRTQRGQLVATQGFE